MVMINGGKREKGFSLIELMIALVMGVFLIGGVISVFIGSSQSFRSNEALSRVQENGRFALEIIAQELRSVGYRGECFSEVTDIIDTSDTDYEVEALDLNEPLQGWVSDAGEFFEADLSAYEATTDLVIIKHAAENTGASLTNDVSQSDVNLSVDVSIDQDAIVVISDGLVCNLFQNTASSTTTISRGTSGSNINNVTSADQVFTREFKNGEATVSFLSSTLFYVGSGLTTSTALRSVSYDKGSPDDQELVEGVTDLTVLYAVVSGSGPSLDYSNTAADITAAGEWDDVVAVRITVDVQGDQNISQQFSTTVALRNRLL